jgi:hypothetical protein
VIEEIVPSTVAGVEAFDHPRRAALYPEEEAVVARAVDKRRREFTTARFCARTAMVALGRPPAPILPGRRRAPGWPDGVAVGIDAAVHGAVPEGVPDLVSTAPEQARLRRLAAEEPGVCWDRLPPGGAGWAGADSDRRGRVRMSPCSPGR